eukprot:s756_g17.t1
MTVIGIKVILVVVLEGREETMVIGINVTLVVSLEGMKETMVVGINVILVVSLEGMKEMMVDVRRVPREQQPRGAGDGPGHDQDGGDESRIRGLDPRRGLPRLAAMRAGRPDQRDVQGNNQQGDQAEQSAPQPSGFSWGGYEADGEHGEPSELYVASTRD